MVYHKSRSSQSQTSEVNNRSSRPSFVSPRRNAQYQPILSQRTTSHFVPGRLFAGGAGRGWRCACLCRCGCCWHRLRLHADLAVNLVVLNSQQHLVPELLGLLHLLLLLPPLALGLLMHRLQRPLQQGLALPQDADLDAMLVAVKHPVLDQVDHLRLESCQHHEVLPALDCRDVGLEGVAGGLDLTVLCVLRVVQNVSKDFYQCICAVFDVHGVVVLVVQQLVFHNKIEFFLSFIYYFIMMRCCM
mmetsp:Transcript_25401/g.55168  ORF Transcript_25401/g.55168 Transcript_25401/m.55168 type:complete len:245 (-) Transcript_25401:144-878(-)